MARSRYRRSLLEGLSGLVKSVIGWGVFFALAFSALLYVPAITPLKNFPSTTVTSEDVSIEGDYAYLRKLVKMNRGFFLPNKTIRVEYEASPGANIEFELLKCSGPPIFEVFKCNPSGSSKTYTAKGHQGSLTIPINSMGMYYLEPKVTLRRGDPVYRIHWHRG